MRVKSLLFAAILCIALLAGLLAGCTTTAPNPSTSPSPSAKPSASPSASPSPSAGASPSASPGASPSADAVTSASIVNTEEAFIKAISKEGTWIIAILNDLKFDKDLVVDGDFKNTKEPPVSQRKLAFYTQDKDRNVTARFTVTAPKMTINSIDCSIQHGTFKGDLYVSAKNFQLIDATVEGNVYFTNADAKSTFKMDDKSKVTGVQELKTS
jgi:hypothetical protein